MARRVVTGVASSGKSVFVSDGPAEILGENVLPPPGTVSVWGADLVPPVPSDGVTDRHARYFPPAGGYRVIVAELPPGTADPLASHSQELIESALPGFTTDARWDDGGTGMHSTKTIDIGLVLDGSVHLELDSGEITELRAGDWYVQNGTRHAWHNRSDRPCRLAIFFVGAAGH